MSVPRAGSLSDPLRRMARDRLRARDLPRPAGALTLAGIADGTHPCVLCGDRISGPIEFRLRFANDTVLHFHGRCHDAWLAECEATEL